MKKLEYLNKILNFKCNNVKYTYFIHPFFLTKMFNSSLVNKI